MPSLNVHIKGELCWTDLDRKRIATRANGRMYSIDAIARLPGGMSSGRSSVTIRVDLEDGSTVLAETSLGALTAALNAFHAADDREHVPSSL